VNPSKTQGFDYRNFSDRLAPTGKKDRYLCPVCNGNDFQIDSKTGKAQCWNSGCDLKQVRDLIAPLPAKTVQPQQERTWEYYDLNGVAVRRTVRRDDGRGNKQIHQEFWHLGRWQAKGVPESIKAELKLAALPYRYHEAIKHDLIFWVEGEQCADRLWGVGLAAVTTIGGCGAFGEGNYGGLFKGKQIVICPDQDLPGIKYAEAIAALYPEAKWLYAFPEDYRWSALPAKGGLDIADWIDAGATKEEILAAVGARREAVAGKQSKVERTDRQITQSIQELLQQNLKPSELEAAKIELAKESGLTDRQLDRLWAKISSETEEVESPDSIKGAVDLLLAAKQATLKLSEVLPSQLARPLDQLARWQNLRPELYLLSLLTATGSLAKNGTKAILQRSVDFEVTPNLFTAIVAESSQKKSPVLKTIVRKPLRKLAEKAKIEHEYQRQEWERQKQEARNNGEDFNLPEPALRIYHYSRATGEAILRQAARVPDQGLLALSDEVAGYFKSANQYRQGRGSDAEDLLEYYDGSGGTVLRAEGVQADIETLNLGLLGAIQPKVLQKLLGDCEDSNGGWARWFFLQQPTVASTLPDEQEGFDVTGLLANLYEQISLLPAQEYRLSPEAFKLFQGYYNRLEIQRVEEANPALRAVFGKTAGRIGKIALGLHLIEAVAADQTPADQNRQTSDRSNQSALLGVRRC
jgi:hypothetical protein